MVKKIFKRKHYAKDLNGMKVEVEILPKDWTFEQEQEKRKEEYLKEQRTKSFGLDISYALVASITKLGLLFFFTWLVLLIYSGILCIVWNVPLHQLTGLATISFKGSYGICLFLTAISINVKKQVKNLHSTKENSRLLELAREYEKLIMELILNIFVYLGFGPLGFYLFWNEFLHAFAKFEKPNYFIVVIGFFILKSVFDYLKTNHQHN